MYVFCSKEVGDSVETVKSLFLGLADTKLMGDSSDRLPRKWANYFGFAEKTLALRRWRQMALYSTCMCTVIQPACSRRLMTVTRSYLQITSCSPQTPQPSFCGSLKALLLTRDCTHSAPTSTRRMLSCTLSKLQELKS